MDEKVDIPEDAEKRLRESIRNYPDFPVPGILFRDLMPILKRPSVLKEVCSIISDFCKKSKEPIQAIAALEARGFIFGPLIALNLNIPFIVIRKKGKLPGDTITVEYEKEYGKDEIQVQKDCITQGDNVLIFDDLLATGGTMAGAIQVMRNAGARVVGTFCIAQLQELKGRERFSDCESSSNDLDDQDDQQAGPSVRELSNRLQEKIDFLLINQEEPELDDHDNSDEDEF